MDKRENGRTSRQSRARRGVGLLAGLALLPALAQAGRPAATLTAFGNAYPSACSASVAKRLQAEFAQLAAGRKPLEAWTLAHTILCRRGKEAEHYALSHMPARLSSTDVSTGDTDADNPPRSYVPRSATLMRKGYAWDANLGDKDDDLAVSFYSDEACIGSFNLRYSGRGWLVVEVGSACD